MPIRDGMGPAGKGPKTGRGFGPCAVVSRGGNANKGGCLLGGPGQALGQGRGRGKGRIGEKGMRGYGNGFPFHRGYGRK